jgi:signal transduction histidine kinase
MEKSGDYPAALHYYKQYKESEQQLEQAVHKESFAKAQNRFDATRQENEIALLQQQKKLQALAVDKQRMHRDRWIIFSGLLFSLLLWLFSRKNHQKQLHNQKLLNEKLVYLDKQKLDFFTQTSSQLQKPLQQILSLSAQETEAMGKNWQGSMAAVNSTAKGMINLLDDIAELAKFKEEQSLLLTEAFDLQDIISELTPLVSDYIKQKNLQFKTELPADLPNIFADKTALLQIMRQLIALAVSYTREGEISLSAVPFNHYIKVSVRDTGKGFSEEELKHIFDNFHTPGEGWQQLGISNFSLARVKMLVELQGGRLTISSIAGQGCIISFTIPQA